MASRGQSISGVVAAGLLLAGCAGGAATAGGGLDVRARFASSCPAEGQPQSGGEPPAGITSFTVTVSGGGLSAPIVREVARGAGDYVEVDGIPAGSDYTVTVEGSGQEDWKGIVTGLSFADGRKTEARVYMTRVGAFTCGPDMGSARLLHAAAPAGNGALLITGGVREITEPSCDFGCDLDAVDTTDLYDPATGTLAPGPRMKHARAGHTATALDDGRIAIVGGLPRVALTPSASKAQIANVAGGEPVAAIEIYDPATNAFTDAGELAEPRFLHGAAAIANGRLVVAGGGLAALTAAAPSAIGAAASSTIEVYDAGTKKTRTVPMGIWRVAPAVAPMDGGKVLVLGGTDPTTIAAEVYDPASPSTTARYAAYTSTIDDFLPQSAPLGATVLPLGGKRFLVRGGMYVDEGGAVFLPVDKWDAAVADFSGGKAKLTKVGAAPTALLHPAAAAGSRLLVCGGTRSFNFSALDACEVRDPATGARDGAATLFTARLLATATALGDGTVLVAGGGDFAGFPKVFAKTEIFRMP